MRNACNTAVNNAKKSITIVPSPSRMARALTMCVGANLLYIAVLVLSSAGQDEHRELYVKSTPNQQCRQGHLCLTLLDCLHNASAAFTTNTTLLFLPGNHSAVWPHNTTLVISNVSNLVLTGPEVGPGEPPQASIWCNYTMQFHFRNTTDFVVRGILFTECGTSIVKPKEELFPSLFDLPNLPAALQFDTAKNMILENVHIVWSHGFGLLTLNSLGCCSITNCKLSNNGRTKGTQIRGNVYFVYQLTEMEQNFAENLIKVSYSEISYGLTNRLTDTYKLNTGAGGMMIVIHDQRTQYRLDIVIVSCTFHHNEAQDDAYRLIRSDSIFVGGLSLVCGMVDKAFSSQVEMLVSNSTFIGHKGGGFYSEIVGSLQILNSRFIDNSGNGARIGLIGFGRSNITITIRNSTFTNNTENTLYGSGGLDIFFKLLPVSDFGHIILEVKECLFEDNIANSQGAGGFSYRQGEMSDLECTQDSMSMNMYDTHFSSNTGGHVTLELLKGSKVLLTNSTFRYGYGSSQGGAISIIVIQEEKEEDIPPCLLLQNKDVFVKIIRATFLNNSAEVGGAISMTVMTEIITQIYIIDCVFLNNSVRRYGGAILLNMRNEKRLLYTVPVNAIKMLPLRIPLYQITQQYLVQEF